MRVAAFALLLAAVSQLAVAAEVQVTLVPQPGARDCLGDGRLVATPEELSGSAKKVEIPLQPDAVQYTLPLGGSRLWRIQMERKSCWTSTLLVDAGVEGAVTLPLYRTGTIGGELSTPARTSLSGLSGTVFLRKSDRSPPQETGDRVECTFDALKWSCEVPSALLDVRLDLPGFADVYWWDVTAAAGETVRLAPQALRQGASIAGWVRDSGGNPLVSARVVATPLEVESASLTRRQTVAKTNARGFFQLTGLSAGQYRVVSHAEHYSPALIAAVTTRDGEAVTWPRAITHVPHAAMELTLEPPVTVDGQPWTVELIERVPIDLTSKPARAQTATAEGRWVKQRLPATVYTLEVSDPRGSVLERREVDLSAGGKTVLLVSVQHILVPGQLLVADEPLEADIHFYDQSGKTVTVSSANDGTFTAAFPRPGSWTPTVMFPPGRTGARVEGETVVVPEERAPGFALEVRLPGGRIRGTVTGPQGPPERAVVHVTRGGRLVTQQMTGEDGVFDLIGLRAGTYAVDAEGKSGTTEIPVVVELERDEASTVKLVLAPSLTIEGTVTAPNGMPASGAVIRVSLDGGSSWLKTVSDMRGRFRYSVPSGAREISLAVLTYAYPSVVLRVPVEAGIPIDISLPPSGGILRLRGAPRALVRSANAVVPFHVLYFPEPFGAYGGGVHLAAGTYEVCAPAASGRECRSVTVTPGGEHTADFSKTENAAPEDV